MFGGRGVGGVRDVGGVRAVGVIDRGDEAVDHRIDQARARSDVLVERHRGDAERLAEAGIEPSVGSVGDSYDNACGFRRCRPAIPN